MKRISILLFAVLITPVLAQAQGSISGRVADSKTGEGVVGANVVIQGTVQGAATDIEGNFIIPNVRKVLIHCRYLQ